VSTALSVVRRAREYVKAACAKCGVYKCRSPDSKSKYPLLCPHESCAEIREQTVKHWVEPANRAVFEASDHVLREGYAKWPRVKEVIEYSKKMAYKKLGIAFCVALRDEAKTLHNMLETNGFEVTSICCMAGGPARTEVGFDSPMGLPRTVCNPLMQAEVLNQSETELNIMLGLCVGHDVLFIKHSRAGVTPLVVKDRVLHHNPVAALSPTNLLKELPASKHASYIRKAVRFLIR